MTDRVLSIFLRPGRADVHCEYMLATQKQAEAMFRNFYPTRLDNSELIGEAALNLDNHGVASWVNRIWEKKEIEILAQQWRKGVPEREFSAAALQGKPLSKRTFMQMLIHPLCRPPASPQGQSGACCGWIAEMDSCLAPEGTADTWS